MREIANWWSYQVLEDDGITFSYENREERAIRWSAKGTDGNECPLTWEPVLQQAGAANSDNFIAYDPNNPLFKIIETVDKNGGGDYMELGWANLSQPGVEVLQIYSHYYKPEKQWYEMTLGFRVWNKWRVQAQSSANAGIKLLFDVVLED